MEKNRRLLRTGKILLDIAELYIPMAAFVILFVLFLVNIFFRYALNNPLTWPYELIVTSFVWLAILSATYVRRVGGHVKFTITYDKMTPRMQLISRIIDNLVTVVFFSIAVPATWDWVMFMAFKGTTNLRIPFSVVYFPAVPFLVLIVVHSLYDLAADIKHLLKHEVVKDELPPEVRV